MTDSTSSTDSSGLADGPVFSWYRDHNGMIYTSGHAAVDVDTLALTHGTLVEETRAALKNLKRTLAAAGSSMTKVVKITAYLTDMNQYAAFNRVYREFFPESAGKAPARTCVEVRRLPFNFKVELEATAHT